MFNFVGQKKYFEDYFETCTFISVKPKSKIVKFFRSTKSFYRKFLNY